MFSKDSIKLLSDDAEAPFDYILGCGMRRQKQVSEQVLARAGRYRKVAGNLEVKAVQVQDRRYIVCRNPEEQKKDAQALQSILGKLQRTLKIQAPGRWFGKRLRWERGVRHRARPRRVCPDHEQHRNRCGLTWGIRRVTAMGR